MTKDEALQWAGGVVALAERLRVTPSAVSQWIEVPELQQHKLRALSRGRLKIDERFDLTKAQEDGE